MSNPAKLGLIILAAAVALVIVIKIVSAVLSLVWPIALIAGIGLIVYGFVSRKALGGGGRSLP